MRPTILCAEPEPLQALSVRKLVLESAKFNVLTAHSTTEALETIKAFPAIAAAVLLAEDEIGYKRITDAIHKGLPNVPVVVLPPRDGLSHPRADHNLSSHSPEQLVDLMRKLLGDPRATDGK